MGNITGTVTFTINAKPIKPKISTSTLTACFVGDEYSDTLKFTGTEPVTLSVDTLPDGLTFDPATGTISGTPTTAGKFTIKVSAANIATQLAGGAAVTKNVKLIIKAKVPVIDAPTSLADGIMGEEYSAVQFTTSAGTKPITWTAGGLPKGLTVSSSGLLSGTPEKAGKFTVNIKAANAGGNNTVKLALVVLQKPEITTKKFNDATDGKKYSLKLSAKGTTPISWDVSGLPDTLTLTPNATGTTLTITGTPATSGAYSVDVTARNAGGTTTTKFAFTVKGVAPKLTAKLAKGKAGENYTGSTITAVGTKPIEITYSISDADKEKFGIESLADLGLTFTADSEAGTAAITGSPTVSIKSLPITFSASNTVSTATKKVTLTLAGTKPAFTDAAVLNLTQATGSGVNLTFEVTGTKNITFTMSKAEGFTLTQTGDYTATLSGTAPAKAKKTTITITAANADGKASKKLVLQTKAAPLLTTAALDDGIINADYSEKIKAEGTKAITWELSGALPGGITFSNGKLSGKPTTAGTYAFTVTAANDVGTDKRNYTLTIDDPNDYGNYGGTSDTTTAESYSTAQTEEAALGAVNTVLMDEYTIAAVLPVVSVDESGMHDFEVALSGDVEPGMKLYWLANSSEPSDDDEIAEFCDSEGAEIDAVPEDRRVNVSAWLNRGVKYAPVIAVKE